ncbi:MAG: transcriptional repressor NrdR [Candidatus Moranbacteria bacterium]|nr:transcriptional repressor NrdR [Candidatus Moranbacteria bacterium]
MKCPFCNHSETKVIDSRDTNENKTIRRRRECEKCQARFSTYEQVEVLNRVVIKRDGSKEVYRRSKMEEGIKRATNKRIHGESLKQLIDEIEAEINCEGKSEITSKRIGRAILEKLKSRDEVAYLRFASVFKSFGSGERFVKEFHEIDKDN